ncbi:RidA family protein [Pinirhizobacter sp.]|uniref:RidA family protein n=1 Tax=Pinirhizobacter sp. TaxID=2950432 RepID=UPI002F3E56F4
MTLKAYNIGVASQIGSYSDAVLATGELSWFLTSGTPGLAADGGLPDGIQAQSELAWQNVIRLLGDAGMGINDIVKVTQYLTRADDIKAYADVRKRYLGEVQPASMLLVVPQLVWPNLLVEVEIIAARKGMP